MERRNKLILELGTGVIIGTAAGLLLPSKPAKDTRHFVVDQPNAMPERGRKENPQFKRLTDRLVSGSRFEVGRTFDECAYFLFHRLPTRP